MAHGRVVRLVRHGAARLEVNMLSRRTYSSGPEYSRPCRLTNGANCAPRSSLGGYPSITCQMMPPPLPGALEAGAANNDHHDEKDEPCNSHGVGEIHGMV